MRFGAHHPAPQVRHVFRQVQSRPVDQRVDQRRAQRKIVGQRWRQRDDREELVEQRGPRLQQAEQVDPARHGVQQPFEAHQRTVRLGRLGKTFQQPRQKPAKGGLRVGAAQGPVTSVEPASDPVCQVILGGKRAVPHHFAHRAFAGRLVLARRQQPIESLGRGRHVGFEVRKKACPVGKAVQMRKPLQRIARRDRVGLPVLQHLDAVLGHAQACIGGGELACRLLRNDVGPGQREQRCACIAAPQARIAAAVDQLVGLREELDLADAAAPALEIEARSQLRLAAIGLADSQAQLRNIVDRAEIDAAPPHEGADRGEEPLPTLNIARGRARADEGGTLPRQCRALVVGKRCVDGHRQRRDLRRRAQPQVDPEDVAFLRMVGQKPQDVARHALRGVRWPGPLPLGQHIGIEQQDRINVRTVVQFACAMLAQRDGEEAVHAVQLGALARRFGNRLTQRAIGEGGQALDHVVERIGARQIGDGQRQRKSQPLAPQGYALLRPGACLCAIIEGCVHIARAQKVRQFRQPIEGAGQEGSIRPRPRDRSCPIVIVPGCHGGALPAPSRDGKRDGRSIRAPITCPCPPGLQQAPELGNPEISKP